MATEFEAAEHPNLPLRNTMKLTPVASLSQRTRKPPIYACSFCDQVFSVKGNWKRHEEEFHEPQKQWSCPETGCTRKFAAENKFRKHHREGHRSRNCNHNMDAAIISNFPPKSAWGCGFCAQPLGTWDARASHIAKHFEDGSTKSDWEFSRVIQGLLYQPKMVSAWQALLSHYHGSSTDNLPHFEWSAESCQELLKDLQCPNDEPSAADIAQLAYNRGLHATAGYDSITPHRHVPIPFHEPTVSHDLCHFFETEDAPSVITSPFNGNQVLQSDPPSVALSPLAVSDAEEYGTVLSNSHNMEDCFQNPKDFAVPCAENLVPSAWSIWPDLDSFGGI